ncbi:MAG: cysteine synthase family protein, partial [Clostridiales Family XIII bacterium]|nr:cysteine synthase family protein [Clostridiales Family XIII bacterium]
MPENRYHTALELIGNTPMVKLNKLVPPGAAEIYLKLENMSIGGSVKDRIALHMIERAEQEGLITPGKTTICESTSGNTGIGLALVCAIKGYRLIIVMGEKASVERRQLLLAYGAELVLVPPSPEGIFADFKVQDELCEKHGYFSLRQFENKYNPETHTLTTGPEILRAFGGKAPDAFVAGVGTGGTLSGTGRYLKSFHPNIRIVAVEPANSAVLSGGLRGPHTLQGIGSGFIPATLDTGVYDEIITVTDEEGAETTRRLARSEGLLLGYTSG